MLREHLLCAGHARGPREQSKWGAHTPPSGASLHRISPGAAWLSRAVKPSGRDGLSPWSDCELPRAKVQPCASLRYVSVLCVTAVSGCHHWHPVVGTAPRVTLQHTLTLARMPECPPHSAGEGEKAQHVRGSQ